MKSSRNDFSLRILCMLLCAVLWIPTALTGCADEAPEWDTPDTPGTSDIPEPEPEPETETESEPETEPENPNLKVFLGDLNWDGVDDRIEVDVTGAQPITVTDGVNGASRLYESRFQTNGKPGGVALVQNYYEQYDALIEWYAYEEVNPRDYRRRQLTIRYEVFALDKTTNEPSRLKSGGQTFETTNRSAYEAYRYAIADLLETMRQYLGKAHMLIDTSTGKARYGDPTAPVTPDYEYIYTDFTPTEPALDTALLLQRMEEAMGGERDMTVDLRMDLSMTGNGIEPTDMTLLQSTTRMEALGEEFPALLTTVQSGDTTVEMRFLPSTLYYNMGSQGKYMILLQWKQFRTLFSQQGELNQPMYDTTHFTSVTAEQNANEQWVITLAQPDTQMTQLLYASMMESMGEIDAKVSILTVSFVITLDASNRIARQEMVIAVNAEFSDGQNATITLTTAWDYTEYGGERVITVPADYDDYTPCTYDDFYESEYDAELLFIDDVNSDGVGEYLYLVNEPRHTPTQPVVDIQVYDPALGNFINSAEVMRTQFSASGFYIYYDENDVPYLLHYSMVHDNSGGPHISIVQASYTVYRIEPETNGVHTYMDVLTRQTLELYNMSYEAWSENYEQLSAFTDGLNALLSDSVMIADSSTGELWLGDGTITMEVDFSWLFVDYLYEPEEGFALDRGTLRVESDTLTVHATPELREDNVIGSLAKDDYVVRIAQSADWSLILYDGTLGYISAHRVSEQY